MTMDPAPIYQTLRVKVGDGICHIQLYRPDDHNAINEILIDECLHALATHAANSTVVVVRGLPDDFCVGADFAAIRAGLASGRDASPRPERLYELWMQLASGPFVSIAVVSGKANAGGIGFVAACDIVLADERATFSLSELLFGLFPACVLPFLMRRIGMPRAHYLTLMTQPASARQALDWGLVDICDADLEGALRKHLLRLRRLSKPAVAAYKAYMNDLSTVLVESGPKAIAANQAMFSDARNLSHIRRYVESGKFPWEPE